MPTTQTKFRQRLEELVRKFQANAAEYLSTEYSEAQARCHFIDPLFDALGWDLEDHAGLGPSRCEVWMEKGETTGKPDYNFRINARTKFFAEAKAPHVKLSGPHILQAKRYAWNHADVSFAVLTDFEEFRLYDATLKPDPEHPDLGLIFQYRYDEYLTDAALADLWQLSRDEVAAGALDKLLKQDAASRRWRVPVDKAFLADLTQWREMLAKDAFRHNSDLDVRALNEAVQVMLDRLIFVRIAEDRRIVQADTLKKLVERWSEGKHRSLRATLNALFETVNEDLNGEVFKPNAALDEAAFDDALTARIIHGLTDGPYDFAVIGVELLGSIYERYLGKTIRVTATRAIVEDKPEVRKAGGVYYTPKYIVDYIVEQTVGKWIEGKTPAQIAKLRIADPACGSGSFLLAAYQKLIDYHVAYYSEHPQEARQDQLWADLVDADPVGGLPAGKRLSILKKGEILTNNIFGVDLDPQAVEITMMSLYIKALEGETTLPHKHGLLPTLANNIKCGNSLIGTDYFEGQLMPDAEEWARVKPFDWESEFAPSSALPRGTGEGAGGGQFDCVIGNPPYLFITELLEADKQYFFDRYETSEYRFDVYGLFMELSTNRLLRHGGYLSFIIPHTLLSNDSFEKLRRLMLTKTSLTSVIDIGPGVFEGAKNETMIFIAATGIKPRAGDKTQVILTTAKTFPQASKHFTIKQASWLDNPGAVWLVKVSNTELVVVEKLERTPHRLGDLCTINQGLRTGDNEKYLSDTPKSGKWKPAAGGKQVGRYEPLDKDLYVYYEPEVLDAPRRREIFESPEKLVIQEIRNITLPRRLIATYDDNQFYCLQSTNVINLLPIKAGQWNIKYLLGVLNSNAANFFFRQRFSGNNHIASNQLAKIPVPPADSAKQSQLVSLVERMLELHKRLASARASADHEMYQRQVEATDREIDELVYNLYGLTEKEIEMVETRT